MFYLNFSSKNIIKLYTYYIKSLYILYKNIIKLYTLHYYIIIYFKQTRLNDQKSIISELKKPKIYRDK